MACMLLILLEAVGEPSSSRKNMRTLGGEYCPQQQISFEARVVDRVIKLNLGCDRGGSTKSDGRQVSRADPLQRRLQLADSDLW